MSVNGVSASTFSQTGAPPINPPSRRQVEDNLGRQMEKALQAGDLNGAQQAYQMLAAFGPNNSGPFKDAKLQAEFQTLGQDLQNGDLAAAQSDNTTLSKDLVTSDVRAAMQDYKAGDNAGLKQAMANLKGDYWAVYGVVPNLSDLRGMASGIGNSPIDVQA